jgi:aminoglycoside 2'-N-acetyltransferase I
MLDPITIKVIEDREIDADLLAESKTLCFSAFGDSFNESDWKHTFGGIRVLLFQGAQLLGHAAIVPRCIHIENEEIDAGYVEAVAVRLEQQRQGLGSKVMREVADALFDEFDLGVLSTGKHSFYARFGWELWAGPTFVLKATGQVRTLDENFGGGLMVLRDSRFASLSLTESITCHERDGDNW